MNIERLQILSDRLKSLPVKGGKRAFNMSVWARRLKKKEREKHGCGIVACAFGHAAYIPKFRAAGLKVTTGNFGKVTFEGLEGFGAAEKFFDLSKPVLHSLFLEPARSPKTVARKIDVLIRAYALGMDDSSSPTPSSL